MKVAFIVTVFPSLAETFILNQITGLLDMGHDVEIFASYILKEKQLHLDVRNYHLMERVHYFNIPENKSKRILKAIYFIIINLYKSPVKILISLNIFKSKKRSLIPLYILIPFLKKNFDVIHCHFGTNGIHGALLKELGVKGKIITTFHGYDMSNVIFKYGPDFYRNLFLNGDLFLPISDYWKNKLIKLNCDERRIIVHHMGIDLEKFIYTAKKIHSGNIIRILTIGRLTEKKGHEYSIKAVSEIVKKHKNIDYIIAGDGPLRNELETLVTGLGIKDYIKFIGSVEQDEVLKLYQQAHIFILPSITASNGDQEGIPVVLMEAQATGLPVVSTYHSGIPEVVVDGKSGFLLPERNVDALSEKLEYLIEHPEIWPAMGKFGRKLVEEKYNIKKLNRQLVDIYQDAIG